MQRLISSSALALALALGACGDSNEAAPEDGRETQTTSGSERAAEPRDSVAITGLMGTIRQDQVENALSPRMQRIMRCFTQRMGDVEFLAGDMRLHFRIHTDGSVAWVYPTDSSMGDRQGEECALGVARGTRFPRPRGGEAEFNWGFGFDADGGRPPLTWHADALGSRADDVRQLARRCHASGHTITAYIAPGGEVLAAGGTMPNQDGAQALDCVLEGVRSMSMPDPGSWPAKIEFEVP